MLRKQKKKRTAHHEARVHHDNKTQPKPPLKFLWVLEAIFVSLIVFAILSIILILYLAATNHRKAQDALHAVTKIIATEPAKDNYRQVTSALGFELMINTKLQNVEAIIGDGDDKRVKTGDAVFTPENYSVVNIYKNSTENIGAQQRGLELIHTTYVSVVTNSKKAIFDDLRARFGQDKSEQQLAEKFYLPISDQNQTYKLTKTEKVVINGSEFVKNSYDIIRNESLQSVTRQTDYITVQNNRPYKATLYQNIGSRDEDLPQFEAVIDSLKFSPLQSSARLTKLQGDTNRSITLSESVLSSFIAHAAPRIISSDPEIQVVARNQPGVVRIASAYCPDFELKLGTVTKSFSGGCAASFGSGFIVTSDGYVGTNGHVVRSTVFEVLSDSIATGNQPIIENYLDFLAEVRIISQATANTYASRAAAGDKDALRTILGSLNDSELDAVQARETRQNGVYAVQLANDAVRFDPKDLKNFNFGSSIVEAQLVDSDYDPYADIAKDGFRDSDVALLKLETPNQYPFNILGSIQGLNQGSKLTVIGFPGAAENELVSKEESVPSVIEGRVSAIRTANGTDNKLIQSDVPIAKGNSGGPAYNDKGEVVGIATYGLTDKESGGANFNYMRDIADLKLLAQKNSINLPATTEGVGKLWESGLEKFSQAYYSSAIVDFEKIKRQYPPHRLADDFIARAQESRVQGKEVTHPGVYYAIIAIAGVLIIVPIVALFIVIRRSRRRRSIHEAYTQQALGIAQSQPPSTYSPSQPPLTPLQQASPAQPRAGSTDMLTNAPAPTPAPTPVPTPTQPTPLSAPSDGVIQANKAQDKNTHSTPTSKSG